MNPMNSTKQPTYLMSLRSFQVYQAHVAHTAKLRKIGIWWCPLNQESPRKAPEHAALNQGLTPSTDRSRKRNTRGAQIAPLSIPANVRRHEAGERKHDTARHRSRSTQPEPAAQRVHVDGRDAVED